MPTERAPIGECHAAHDLACILPQHSLTTTGALTTTVNKMRKILCLYPPNSRIRRDSFSDRSRHTGTKCIASSLTANFIWLRLAITHRLVMASS